MTPKVRIGLEVAAAIVGLVVLGAYISAREDRVKMDATLQAQKTVLEQYAKDRADHEKQDAARDAQTAETLRSMQQTIVNLKTPEQHAAWDQAQLEQAIKGIKITVAPNGEATATIPKDQLPNVTAAIETCKECKVKLDAATANLASRAEEMKIADAQIQALKTERDSAVKAAKGGSWIHRAGRNLKVILCSGAGAAAGSGQGAKGAAAGAIGGALVCSLF